MQQGYGTNALNQIASAGSTRFGYDPQGGLASDGARSYGYTPLEQLSSVQGAGSSVTLAYDAAHRLSQVQGSALTRFAYDGSQISEELDGSGQVLSRYVPGPDGQPLVWYQGPTNANRSWRLRDQQGSVIALANASGQASAVNTYDAYGQPGPANSGRFQYTGQAWIPEAGLYDYKARTYSPTLGRFLQPDPIGYGDGLNGYAYTHGDPVNGIDPTGTEFDDPDEDGASDDGGGGGGDGGGADPSDFGGYIDYTYAGAVSNNGANDCPPGVICVVGHLPPVSPASDSSATVSGAGAPNTTRTITVTGHRKPQGKGQNGKAPAPPNACQLVQNQPGPVIAGYGSATGVVGYGVTGSVGVFYNIKTGSSGYFLTGGGGTGADVSVSIQAGIYSSAANLSGISQNVNLTIPGLSGSLSASPNGQIYGGSIGPGEGLGVSGTVTNTKFFGCVYRGG